MGERNGRYRHGQRTKEALAENRRIRKMLAEWRELEKMLPL